MYDLRLLAVGVLVIVMGVVSTAEGESSVRHTRKTKAFVHPGVMHTLEDLKFIHGKIESQAEPWYSAWNEMRKHKTSRLSWRSKPHAEILRGPYNNPNRGANELLADSAAAYAHALQWCLIKNPKHAEKAVEILNGYGEKVKTIGHHDARLLVGMAGIKLVAAAELIKHTYDGWAEKGRKQFEKMLRSVMYEVIKDFYPSANGNWDASMIQTMMAMGIFLDDHAMFDRAANYFLRGKGNGCITMYFNAFGQCQESGRDQAHTQMGLGFLANVAELAWKQGVDLYGAADNRLLKGYEYTAKYNLGHDVPYEPYVSFEKRYHYKKISDKARGRFNPIYERVYHHYVNRKGLKMPYVKQVLKKIRPQRYSGAFLPWESLTVGN